MHVVLHAQNKKLIAVQKRRKVLVNESVIESLLLIVRKKEAFIEKKNRMIHDEYVAPQSAWYIKRT